VAAEFPSLSLNVNVSSHQHLGKAALHALRGPGVQLSIDDFGTGYSSLAYLRELPVDELKIDRAFIARTELTGQDLALVRTIVELAQILGLRVVGEGIENASQLAALRGLGRGYGQGSTCVGRPTRRRCPIGFR
jgi:EAL domain-containing protein (putative c-di-GMP-specific phosphodiesterase class I)